MTFESSEQDSGTHRNRTTEKEVEEQMEEYILLIIDRMFFSQASSPVCLLEMLQARLHH